MTPAAAHGRLAWARLTGYAQLARPANLVTAAADVAAGYAVAGAPGWPALALLATASMALYAGGVVLNDAFDAPRDAIERSERPIPAGRVGRAAAFGFGGALLGAGIAVAAIEGAVSMWVAIAIALTALGYDAGIKHHRLFGPLMMATARALNLLLGVSSMPALVAMAAPYALLSFAHVATLTWVSRGETGGADAPSVTLALSAAAILALLLVVSAPAPLMAAPFAVVYAALLLPAYAKLRRTPDALSVRRAVRAGVLALIALDAALAAGHAGAIYGLIVLALWPLATLLARRFSVS